MYKKLKMYYHFKYSNFEEKDTLWRFAQFKIYMKLDGM